MTKHTQPVDLAWLFGTMKADLTANIFFKSKMVLVMFRLAHYLALRSKLTMCVGVPYFIAYKFFVEWILGMEIPIRTRVGKGFVIYHGFGLVIHGQAVIGENVKIRHGVTLGNKILRDGTVTSAPVVGNDVEFGANSSVLGPLTIGNGSVIGAGAVVTRDVPAYAVMVGVPARQSRGS